MGISPAVPSPKLAGGKGAASGQVATAFGSCSLTTHNVTHPTCVADHKQAMGAFPSHSRRLSCDKQALLRGSAPKGPPPWLGPRGAILGTALTPPGLLLTRSRPGCQVIWLPSDPRN